MTAFRAPGLLAGPCLLAMGAEKQSFWSFPIIFKGNPVIFEVDLLKMTGFPSKMIGNNQNDCFSAPWLAGWPLSAS